MTYRQEEGAKIGPLRGAFWRRGIVEADSQQEEKGRKRIATICKTLICAAPALDHPIQIPIYQGQIEAYAIRSGASRIGIAEALCLAIGAENVSLAYLSIAT